MACAAIVRRMKIALAAIILFALSATAYAETCVASHYGLGDGYHGKRTASGAIFNTHATSPYTAAHKTRPLGSFATVTNLASGRSISVKITDRGPFIKGRCIDLGIAGAKAIGMDGLATVSVN